MTDGVEDVRARRSLSIREIVTLATLVLNFGGLIWAAATLSATVGELKETTSGIKKTMEVMAAQLVEIRVDHDGRLRVLEDRSQRGTQ